MAEIPQDPTLEEWALQPRQHHYVRQQNRLVEARYHLSARELKLVLYVCAMVDPHAKNFGKCKIRVRDFADVAGLESDDLYTQLRDTALAIRGKPLVFENYLDRDDDGKERPRRKTLSWFIDVTETSEGDGYVKVTLHPDLKPYLLQLQRDFTAFRLGYAVRLESKYAIRLYQLLKRWAYRGQKEIAVDDLRVWLGTRQLDKDGKVIEETLAPYKSLKQRAIQPAVDELNEGSDLSVSFSEMRYKGVKTVAALCFRIRPNLKNAEKFGVSSSETSEEDVEVSGEVQAQLEAIAQEFGLSARQAEALQEYVKRDGLEYVLEKAAVVRSRPRDNAAACFIGALRGDWKKPVPIAKPKPKNKAPVTSPEPSPVKPDFEPMARLWSEATEAQRTAWLKDDLLRQTAPKNGEQPRPIFLARLYCLTQPAEGGA
jgi:plasmid replication initiation protein